MTVFISETTIENILALLENENEQIEQHLKEFAQKQPILYSYLLSEGFDILIEEEKELLLFLALVIFKSVEAHQESFPLMTQESLGDKEEQNWETLNESVGKSFRDKLDIFFKDYPQEDLLAFVEDALTLSEEAEEAEENSIVTKEGREPMFIALKTIIDVLTENKGSEQE